MKTENQDDTLLSALSSWINKHAEEKHKKASQTTTEVKDESLTLVKSVTSLADSLSKVILEVSKLTKSVSGVIKMVNEHSTLIEELYKVQNGILYILKSSSPLEKSTLNTSSVDVSDKTKKKTEKPN